MKFTISVYEYVEEILIHREELDETHHSEASAIAYCMHITYLGMFCTVNRAIN